MMVVGANGWGLSYKPRTEFTSTQFYLYALRCMPSSHYKLWCIHIFPKDINKVKNNPRKLWNTLNKHLYFKPSNRTVPSDLSSDDLNAFFY